MQSIAEMRQKNCEAIQNAILQLEVVNYESVSELIPTLLKKSKLVIDTSMYIPIDSTQKNGIGRYCIYDHMDPDNLFSIWIFVLGPSQKTSIHSHRYKGTVAVLEGPVAEKNYRITQDSLVTGVTRANRYRFHANSDTLSEQDTLVHQLVRRKVYGSGLSITLHIYNMPEHQIDAEGNQFDSRNINCVFTKDPRIPTHFSEDYENLGAIQLT